MIGIGYDLFLVDTYSLVANAIDNAAVIEIAINRSVAI